MTRNSLGEFEQQVLLALLRLGGESYSVPIVLELEERTGKEIAQAAVFIVLQRMEKKGLVRSRLQEESEESGHTRRYFKATTEALAQLRERRRITVRLWDGLEELLDES